VDFLALSRDYTHSVKLESRVKKFGTDDLLPLWVADMDIASPSCIQDALAKRAAHPIYGYTIYPEEYYGSITNWMQKRFETTIEKEWIVPAYGVVPSINFTIRAFTQQDDGIIVQTPIYPPFISSVRKHKRKLLENKLLYRDGVYSIDFEDFEEKAKKAKLFLFCSPHNPTGRAWSLDELKRLVEICQKYNVLIVSDEIHSDIVYTKRHYPLITLAPDSTILLNAPSKTFNIAGLNTSYALIPNKKLRIRYQQEQLKAGLGDGNLFGIEALISAYSSGAVWLDALKLHLQANISFVNDYLVEHAIPIKATETQATFLMWLDCRAFGLSDEALEEFFIHKAKLGLNSGVSFAEAGSGFMRLNIATSQEVLAEAMSRLHDAYVNIK